MRPFYCNGFPDHITTIFDDSLLDTTKPGAYFWTGPWCIGLISVGANGELICFGGQCHRHGPTLKGGGFFQNGDIAYTFRKPTQHRLA